MSAIWRTDATMPISPMLETSEVHRKDSVKGSLISETRTDEGRGIQQREPSEAAEPCPSLELEAVRLSLMHLFVGQALKLSVATRCSSEMEDIRLSLRAIV